MCGCTTNNLTVHTEYISEENLASYHVETPDPLLLNPPIGQQLIVIWSIPRTYSPNRNLLLNVTVRFRNHQEITESVELTKLKGTYIYTLVNEDYLATRGILTYKIDLIEDGEIIEAWRHQIWTELITLNVDK